MANEEIKGKSTSLIILHVGTAILLGVLLVELIRSGGAGRGILQIALISVGAIIAIIGAIFIYFSVLSSGRLSPKIPFVVVMAAVLWIATGNIMNTGKRAISSLYFILKNPSLSYDEKLKRNLPFHYKFFKFVKENTPSASVIMLPPEIRPRLAAGPRLAQYFLHPRKLLVEDREKIASDKTITHILVWWGEWPHENRAMYGWPKFPVLVRKFVHLPRGRAVFVDGLSVNSKAFRQNLNKFDELLENEISDSEKKVNHHQLGKFKDHLIEYIHLTYTSSSYDYWTKVVRIPLMSETAVTIKVRAYRPHSVNLIAEIEYDNGKSAIFGSAPNREGEVWEKLSISSLYKRTKEYALLRGWDTRKMRLVRIGVDTGVPLKMPYLERYGLIELERGQERTGEERNIKIECAPIFLARGDFYRAKNQLKEALANYQLAEKLNPEDAWVHFNLGDVYQKQGGLKRAMEEYRKAILLEPDVAWFHFALGEIYRQQNELDLSIESFKKALEIDSSGGWTYNGLGSVYLKKGEYERARAYFRQGLRYGHGTDFEYAGKMLEKIRQKVKSQQLRQAN